MAYQEVMTLDIFSAQARVWERLSQIRISKQVGGAYLFSGPAGCGKESLAIRFAQLLNCETSSEKPCDTCPSCQRFRQLQHEKLKLIFPLPAVRKKKDDGSGTSSTIGKGDMELVTEAIAKKAEDHFHKIKIPKSTRILIQSIRELRKTLYLKSEPNGRKIVLIFDAHLLSVGIGEAANALLKILEEPKYNTYFILITNQISSLLATLRSRCLKFNFEKPSFEGFNKILLFHNDKLKSEEISFLFDLSNGSPGLALELFSEDIKDIYSTLLEILSIKESLSTKVINLSTCVSSYSNDQFKIYISIIKFILITILKIKAGCNFSNSFRSNILHSLEKLSSTFDNLICFEILEYINNNENDLFTYNLDKNIFNLNIFTPLNKIT